MDDYPNIYNKADGYSNGQQKLFFKLQILFLMSMLFTTFNFYYYLFGFYATAIKPVLFLTALAASIFLFFLSPDQGWYSGRAIAESVKNISWRFMMKTQPYNQSNQQAIELFDLRISAIVKDHSDYISKMGPNDGRIVTQQMIDVRKQNFNDSKVFYRKFRVVDQLQWYSHKSTYNRNLARNMYIVLFVTLIFSFITVVNPSSCIAAIMTPDTGATLATGVLTWIQAKRYSELSASYTLTSHEISSILERLDLIENSEQLSDFVDDAENAFSREHTQWAAQRRLVTVHRT